MSHVAKIKQCQKYNGRNHFATVCKKDGRINHVMENAPSVPLEHPQGRTSTPPDMLQLRSREIQRTRENAVQHAETPSALSDGVQHIAVPDHTSTRPRRLTKPPTWLKDYVH